MRFDKFTHRYGVVVAPVDLFAGLVVEVGMPPGWEPFDSARGLRVWACHTDPRIDVFCANAVLTMHCVEAALDAGDVFTMLAEQQLQSALGARERSRALIAATEGPGVVGVLAMQIADELGVIESSSRARIITTEQETMIAQVTVTALKNSPVNRAGVWLTVRPGTASDSVSSGPRRGGVPATGMRGDH